MNEILILPIVNLTTDIAPNKLYIQVCKFVTNEYKTQLQALSILNTCHILRKFLNTDIIHIFTYSNSILILNKRNVFGIFMSFIR